jgi:hypothetical protein
MRDGSGMDHWGFRVLTLRNPIVDIQNSTFHNIEYIQYNNPYALAPTSSPAYHSFRWIGISKYR